ncbi:MAG: sugar transferase [Anaerolineae bacterium]|uniref:sugar transferase n=1 Tax=Promineifilum sp. TaxID=2664178 RepID=UPI001DA8CD6C|nr:sugar transferase [Anaerolineales bacterium]MCB8935594.1 sugar transferase [Promineifilum sp.]MCO5180609.1 sugar transferase [Promineifilum sp.]MCW5847664.1 sugar transferase [Anaerolineae bacterium]
MNESVAPQQPKADIKLQDGLSDIWRTVDGVARRSLDILISTLGMIILGPIFLFLALLIKRDSPGPVFYWGARVGQRGRPFRILKFRTMYEDTASYDGPKVTGMGDPRITPLGQWLRDTKINELPQLWNVLKGDMSLVGPRPEDNDFVTHWPAEVRDTLLAVRPGITSPASVLYRDEENMLQTGNVVDQYLKSILPSKLRLDVLYVNHRSFLTDLDVMFWTLLALLPQLKTRRVPEHLLFWGPLARFISRYFSWFVLDSLMAFVAVAATGLLWRSNGPLELGWGIAMGVALTVAFIFSMVNALLGIGRVVWSRADFNDAFALAISSGLTTLILLMVNLIWQPRAIAVPYIGYRLLPSGLIMVSGVLAFVGFALLRYRMRIITGLSEHWITLRGGAAALGERVLIVGAGEVGSLASYLLRKAELGQAYTIVGMVDDAPRKQGTRISGIQVLGRTEEIPELVSLHDVGLIIYAIEKIRQPQRERILQLCRVTGVQTVVLPDVLETFRSQLVAESTMPALGSVGTTNTGGAPRLENWLVEVESLMQAEAWDAAHAQIRAMQQQVVMQNQAHRS